MSLITGWWTLLFPTQTDTNESTSSSSPSGTTSVTPKCTTSSSNEKFWTDISSANGSTDLIVHSSSGTAWRFTPSDTSHTKTSSTSSKSHEENGEDFTLTFVKPSWFTMSTSKCTTCKGRFRHIEFDNEQRVCPLCMNKDWIE